MLKKLQRKFVKIAFISMLTVVLFQLVAVNAINILQRDASVRNTLEIITLRGELNETMFGDDNFFSVFNPFRVDNTASATPYTTKYFVVHISNNIILNINKHNVPELTDSKIVEMASRAYRGEEGFGSLDEYRYLFTTDKSNGISTITFVNYERELKDTLKLAGISLLVGMFLICTLIIPIMIFSKRAVLPVERSIEKQKQFITDASHELKTPIAIISANAEVLEMCEGENEWTTSIRNQTSRLNTLVKNLVTLSKLEETRNKPVIESFNLSDALYDVAAPFETPAKGKGIEIIYDISDGIKLTASESEIRQLIEILCDNAVKYTTEGGIFKISARKKGRITRLEFYNDCENIEPEKLSKLFDRFYRTDTSRNSKTGGHGIGLSIAQISTERNGGQIKAVSTKPNSVTFIIEFGKSR